MKRFALTAFLLIASGAATAQPTLSEVQRAAMVQQDAQVRISIGISMFIPSADGPAFDAQEGVRKQIYELANKECALLRETIAGDCRMETINVNVNRQRRQQPVDGFNVSANISYRISLK
jgi:hypothetical protein